MLVYKIIGSSVAKGKASFSVNEDSFDFGITPDSTELASPVDLLLGAFAACVLKNVERFSSILKFSYESAGIEVIAQREDRAPVIIEISYVLKIRSDDEKLNAQLLQKNITKHGTIYNTLAKSTQITGTIEII